MMLHLLLIKEKPKIFLTRLFKALSQLSKVSAVAFTNLVQHKYELGSEELLNHASYYCQSTSEHTTHKLYLERPDPKKGGTFKLANLKGHKMEACFDIG